MSDLNTNISNTTITTSIDQVKVIANVVDPVVGELKVTMASPIIEVNLDTIELVPILISGGKGEDGYTPIKGVDYFDGEDGSLAQDLPIDNITYNIDGTIDVITTSIGTRSMVYEDGKLSSIIGSGEYKTKNFNYIDGKLVSIEVI